MANQKRIYFEHLDVVRFLAAFMIVILHAYEAWVGWYGEVGFLSNGSYRELSIGGKFIDQFIRNLGIGVDVFFLLSGFLITYILLEEKKRFNKINIGFFMIRRSLRIWPLYFFLIAISPFLVDWLNNENHPNYFYNAFFIGNFDIINSKSWVYPFSHFWSICIEEHFYLIWPFVIAFVSHKRLLPVFLIFILSSISFRLYTGYTMDYPWYTLFAHTLSRIDVLVIGAIGGYYYSQKPFTINIRKSVRCFLFIVLISSLLIEPVVAWNSLVLVGFKKYFYLSIIAILLLDFNFNPLYNHILNKNSFIHYLGKVSYGIYMYSNILLLVIIKKIMVADSLKNIYFFFFITILLSILVPILSYELFEKHVLKLNTRFRKIKTRD